MKEYVGNFIKMKIENTGVKNQQECDEVNAYHNRLGFDFEIKPENTVSNPGLHQVAKICLNSLWGKFGQRCGMDGYEFIFDYNTLIRKFINNNKKWTQLGTLSVKTVLNYGTQKILICL